MYQIHVDIPGLEAETYTISPTSDDTTQAGFDFVVSEEGITTVASEPTGIKIIQASSDMRLYPNPSNGDMNVVVKLVNSEIVSYSITNLLGEVVQTKSFGTLPAGIQSFEINDLTPGMYSIAVTHGAKVGTFKALVLE